MNITIIGTGYVGLVTGACLADLGNHVFCLDVDQAKIDLLNSGGVPIYEPGLKEIIERNVDAGRLTFSTDIPASVAHGSVQFIAVGTPPDEDGSADLQYVLAAARNIGRHMTDFKVVVDKSTVPVGTADKVTATINAALVIASEARQSRGHGSPRPFGSRDDDAGAVIASPTSVIASEARQSMPPLPSLTPVIASAARQSRGHGSPRPFGPRDDDAGAAIATTPSVIASEARQSMPPLPSLTSVIASGRGSLPDMADKIYSRDLFRQD